MTSYWSTDLCLIASFMLKNTGIADTMFLQFFELTPFWLEDGFIQVNIDLSKRNF